MIPLAHTLKFPLQMPGSGGRMHGNCLPMVLTPAKLGRLRRPQVLRKRKPFEVVAREWHGKFSAIMVSQPCRNDNEAVKA